MEYAIRCLTLPTNKPLVGKVRRLEDEELASEQASVYCWHNLVRYSSPDVSICHVRLLYSCCE